MGKKKSTATKRPRPKTPADPQPRRVAYGGELIRSFGSLPGLLERFVHVQKTFTDDQFKTIVGEIEACFGRTNSEPILVDEGIEYPAGALFGLGADGHSAAGKTVLVFKFVPIVALYPPHDYGAIFDAAEILN